MRVEVIKIGEYDPTQDKKYSRYTGYCLSTREEVDLPITDLGRKALAGRPAILHTILHSTLLRAMETARCLPKASGVNLIPLSQLREVPFKLENLVSKEEFEKWDEKGKGSNLVRQRFVEAFIQNSLMQSREQIRDNIHYVIGVLKGIKEDGAVIISHSFFMKMLEAFVNGRDIFSNPEEMRQVIDPNKKTYPFGGGFFFEV